MEINEELELERFAIAPHPDPRAELATLDPTDPLREGKRAILRAKITRSEQAIIQWMNWAWTSGVKSRRAS